MSPPFDPPQPGPWTPLDEAPKGLCINYLPPGRKTPVPDPFVFFSNAIYAWGATSQEERLPGQQPISAEHFSILSQNLVWSTSFSGPNKEMYNIWLCPNWRALMEILGFARNTDIGGYTAETLVQHANPRLYVVKALSHPLSRILAAVCSRKSYQRALIVQWTGMEYV